MANDKRKGRKREYTHSPWSGKAYEQAPSEDDLANESMQVLNGNAAISKARRLESMDSFIERYKAQHGIQ